MMCEAMNTGINLSSCRDTSVFLNSVGVMALQQGLFRDASDVFSEAVMAMRDSIHRTAETQTDKIASLIEKIISSASTVQSKENSKISVGVMRRVGSGFVRPKSCDFCAFSLSDGAETEGDRQLRLSLLLYNYGIALLCLIHDDSTTSTRRKLLKKSFYVLQLSRGLLSQCADNCDTDEELERILRITVCVLQNQLRILTRFDAQQLQIVQVQENLSRLLVVIRDLEIIGIINDDGSPCCSRTAAAA